MTACDDASDLRHEVQRLLGRCLLRLQQYETLTSNLIASHQLSGVAYELARIRARRVEDHATRSLGYQIGVLLKSCFTTDTQPSADDDAEPLTRSLQMSAQDYARTVTELRCLVDARNEIVHSFASRFDLQTAAGCSAACDYLEGCYARIDAHYAQLCA